MYHIIINPAAGAGRAAGYAKTIESHLRKRDALYEVCMTARPMDARQLAQRACAEKSEGVICVGGDGTLQETAAGMLYSGVPLGIVPAGSGNDFIASLGIKHNIPVEKALDAILDGNAKKIDLIKMNDLYFMNIGSIGLDAEIVNYAQKYRRTLKRSAYLFSTVKNVFTFEGFEMRIALDDIEVTSDMTLMAVCNGKYYGGGFKIAPSAQLDDGIITVCAIKKLSRLQMTTLFPTVIFGAHSRIANVEFYQCKKVTAWYDGYRRVNLDGNLYNLPGPVEFEICPGAVRVFA